jgi:hypothetical protein
MHNNINKHVHVKNKVVYKFYSPLPPMHDFVFKTTSNRWELSIFTTIPPYISKKIVQYLKDLKENEDISFFKNKII